MTPHLSVPRFLRGRLQHVGGSRACKGCHKAHTILSSTDSYHVARQHNAANSTTQHTMHRIAQRSDAQTTSPRGGASDLRAVGAIPRGQPYIRTPNNHRRSPPPPPHKTKVTPVGKNEIYNAENLIGPFLVHKLSGPRPPSPPSSLLMLA